MRSICTGSQRLFGGTTDVHTFDVWLLILRLLSCSDDNHAHLVRVVCLVTICVAHQASVGLGKVLGASTSHYLRTRRICDTFEERSSCTRVLSFCQGMMVFHIKKHIRCVDTYRYRRKGTRTKMIRKLA